MVEDSLLMSVKINNLELELADLKQRNQAAESKIESKLKAAKDYLEILGRKVSQSQAFLEIAQFVFGVQQRICLQQVSKRFYYRVAQWMETVYRNSTFRRSLIVCIITESTKVF